MTILLWPVTMLPVVKERSYPAQCGVGETRCEDRVTQDHGGKVKRR